MCAVYDRKSQDADHATHKYLSVKHEGDWYYDYIIYKNLNLTMKMQSEQNGVSGGNLT